MTRTMLLTRGQVVLVDDDDYMWLSQWKWSADSNGNRWYAIRMVKTEEGQDKKIYMHRQILNAPPGVLVDHINHDGLDCRKENMRLCSVSQNNHNQRRSSANTSRYKGVTWDKNRNKWMAKIKADGRHIYLGRFVNEIEAAQAYDQAARKHFGEYAHTNFGTQS